MSLNPVALSADKAVAPRCAHTWGASYNGDALSAKQGNLEPSDRTGLRLLPTEFVDKNVRIDLCSCGSGVAGLTSYDQTNARYQRK